MKHLIYILLFIFCFINIANAQLRVLVLQMQVDDTKNDQLVKKAMYLTEVINSKVVTLAKEKYIAITKENLMMLLPPDQTLEACIGECEVNIGRIVGSQRVVSSMLFGFENHTARLNIKLMNTENGAVVNSLNLKANSINELEDKINLSFIELFEGASHRNLQSSTIPEINQGLDSLSTDDIDIISIFELCQKGKVESLLTLNQCEQFLTKAKDQKYLSQKDQVINKIKSCKLYLQMQKEKQEEELENKIKLKTFEKKRDQDWAKLAKLLKLESITHQQKEAAVMKFFEIYGTNPSLNPYLYFDEPYVKSIVDILLK